MAKARTGPENCVPALTHVGVADCHRATRAVGDRQLAAFRAIFLATIWTAVHVSRGEHMSVAADLRRLRPQLSQLLPRFKNRWASGRCAKHYDFLFFSLPGRYRTGHGGKDSSACCQGNGENAPAEGDY
jgi:hypothetical protein